MKYMLMFWVDESAQVTADEDAAMMIAVKSWVEQMTERGVRLYGGPAAHLEVGMDDGLASPSRQVRGPGTSLMVGA
jgi:CII-binding regulator of phage lambda lysogenization HflD